MVKKKEVVKSKPVKVKEVESGHAKKETGESLIYQAKKALHEAHLEGDQYKVKQLEKDLVKLCEDIAESTNSSNQTKKHHGNKKA
jgi:hypothetical protein